MLLQVSIPNDSSVYATPFIGRCLEPRRADPTVQFAGPAHAAHHRSPASRRSDVDEPRVRHDRTCRRIRRSSSPSRSRSRIRSRSSAMTQRSFSIKARRRPGRRPPRERSTSTRPSTPTSSSNLENFTIKFDMSSPIRWSNPAGTEPALFDPENNPTAFSTRSSIPATPTPTRISRSSRSTNMTIYGPPAFDGSSYASLQSQLGNAATRPISTSASKTST